MADKLDIYQELINRDAVPGEHREVVDELIRRGVLKGKAQPQQPGILDSFGEAVKPVTSTLRQFNDALMFGFYDKGVSAAKAATTGQTYDQAISQERKATQAAGQETLPWLIGQTGGNVVQGLISAPVSIGNRLSKVIGAARETILPQLYKSTVLLDDGAKAATTMSGQALRSGLAINESAKAPVNALMSYYMGLPTAARYGAAYASADAAGHSDGSIGKQISDVAIGAAGGAALGPLVYTGMHGAGAATQRVQMARERWKDANAARMQEARDVGIDAPLPAIVSNGPVAGLGSRMVGAGIGGGAVNAQAAQNINQLTGTLNRTLSRPLQGQEAGDLGRSIQGDLRRAVVERSRSSDEVSRMPRDDLQQIAGPVTEEGFAPPRPRVDPIQPRQVDPIQPRDVGPEPPPPAASNSVRELTERVAASERDIQAATADHNTMLEASRAIEQRFKPLMDNYAAIAKKEQDIRAQFETMDQQGGFIKYRTNGETVESFNARKAALAQEHGRVVAEMNKMAPDVAVAQNAFKQYGSPEARIERIRNLSRTRNALEAQVADARAREAAENVRYEKARADHETARIRATAEAEAETARIREQARLEAESATSEAQRAAQREYERNLAENGPGFRSGGSRESYPTELSAAYELAGREAPRIQMNPLGDGYGGTATTQLLESVAREGKQNLSIRGQGFKGNAFNADGDIDPAFVGYLRSRIGNDMTQRIEALSELRKRGPIAQPALDGIKGLLSDMRRLAREAERSRYSATPRTEDAALLRRLATSIQQDFYSALGNSGTVNRFRTEQGGYELLPGGSSRLGSGLYSDQTYYVRPEMLRRMTRGDVNPGQEASIPATLSLRSDRDRVGFFNNQSKTFDRSTLVPFSTRPDPGLIPIQVWADGTRVRYGTPIVDRPPTTGERAVQMFQNVDQQYADYINEIRTPLAKIFGDKVDGVQAMDRLVKAAKKGETGLLGAYMRVMREKNDPVRGASAIIYHMSNGGRDLSRFLEEWRDIHPAARRILFQGQQGQALERELNRFVTVGERLDRFVNTAQRTALVDPGRITHILTLSAAWTNLPAVLGLVAGNAAAARVLSSPRLVRWMTTMPEAARGGFDTPRWSQHLARLSALGVRDEDAKALHSAVIQSIAGNTNQRPN